MSNLKWFDTAETLLKVGNDVPGCNVFEVYKGPFPLVEDAAGDRLKLELVNAHIHKVSVGDDDYAAVVLCRIKPDGSPEWTIYCGDGQVGGKFRNDGKNLATQLRTEGKVANALANNVEASGWVDKIKQEAQCGFFKTLERSGRFCTHTQAVLKSLNQESLDQMATDLIGWKSGAAVTATPIAGVTSEEEAAFYDAAFIQPVLLAGERGSGKTFLARAAADKFDAVYLELQCHPSMEPWEFRAHDRAADGKVYTVLGVFAQAVYWIQKGKRVVLCLDEFMNMNPMYTTTINSPLSLTKDDTYMIETGRLIPTMDDEGKPNGMALPEVVEVPADMLWVVATTNIGARYGLDKIAPSVRARFQIQLMNTNADRTRHILERQLSKYSMPLEIAEKFEKFINAANEAQTAGTLDEEVTTRLASNVIRAVYLRTVRDKKVLTKVSQWLPLIKKQVEREIAQVVNFEIGELDPEQEMLFKTLVNSCFK